jgi:alginate O-acetyltransferase complex protein AlgI
MLFNSPQFILFFAVVYAAYLCLRSPQEQNWLVLAANYVFHGWAVPRYVVLLIFYTAATFAVGIKIDNSGKTGSRTAWLATGMLARFGEMAAWESDIDIHHTSRSGSARST